MAFLFYNDYYALHRKEWQCQMVCIHSLCSMIRASKLDRIRNIDENDHRLLLLTGNFSYSQVSIEVRPAMIIQCPNDMYICLFWIPTASGDKFP